VIAVVAYSSESGRAAWGAGSGASLWESDNRADPARDQAGEYCCGRGVQTGLLCHWATGAPELRAGLEPATCRWGVDNRTCSGPQQR